MTIISTIGLDIAKSVFHVVARDQAGHTMFKRKLRRQEVLVFFAKQPACLVGMEACGTAHYWAREISKCGHDVRLLPAQHVKAYVQRGKHDFADAGGCAEAVVRPAIIPAAARQRAEPGPCRSRRRPSRACSWRIGCARRSSCSARR